MLQQTMTSAMTSPACNCGYPAAPRALAMTLLAEMRRALDEDPGLARQYLERLSELLIPRTPVREIEGTLVPRGFSRSPSKRKGGLAAWQERRVIEHVEANLGRPIPANELAELLGLSTGHFMRAFKASTGETPHAYLVRQRIRRAQLLMLEAHGEPLCRIAIACGFADQSHFSRQFRDAVGVTPTFWRRSCEWAGQSVLS